MDLAGVLAGQNPAVTWVSLSTEKTAAFTPPKVTLVAPVKVVAVIVTCVPAGVSIDFPLVCWTMGVLDHWVSEMNSVAALA